MSTTKLAEALRDLRIAVIAYYGASRPETALGQCLDEAAAALASYEAEPAVQVVVERERVWIKRGVQSFALAYEAETDAEREWYAKQLRAALSGFTPDVKAAPAAPAPLTDEQIDRLIEHSDCWTGPGLGARFKKEAFARLVEQAHGIGIAASKESGNGQ
jgi:hypothetical protein